MSSQILLSLFTRHGIPLRNIRPGHRQHHQQTNATPTILIPHNIISLCKKKQDDTNHCQCDEHFIPRAVVWFIVLSVYLMEFSVSQPILIFCKEGGREVTYIIGNDITRLHRHIIKRSSDCAGTNRARIPRRQCHHNSMSVWRTD